MVWFVPSAIRRWPGSAALSVAALLFLSACDSPEVRAQKHYDRGQTMLEQGDTSRARLEFRNAVRLDRNHAGARFAIGELAEREGNLRGAVNQYRMAAEADPTHVRARIKLAEINLVGGQLEEARQYADEAAALDPDNAGLLAVQAAILYRSGDTDGGLALAGRALEIDPGIVTAHALLIGHQVQSDRIPEALDYIDRVLVDMPDNEALHSLKLQVLAQSQDEDGVLAQLEVMAELFPEQPRYRLSLAQIHAASGRLPEAEAELRSLLGRDPGNADAALALAQVVYAQRGDAAAVEELTRQIAALPATDVSLPVRFALADLHRRSGRFDAAVAVLRESETAMSQPADRDQVRVQLARIELSRNNLDEVKRLVDEVLERDGNNADALAIRASLEIDDYRPEDAILTLRRALNADPQNAQLMLLEARAHERNGNPTLARERLASATRASNFDPDIAMRYVSFLRGLNEVAAAETVAEEAARRHPTNSTLLTALAEMRIVLGDLAGAEAVVAQLRALEDGVSADRIAAATLLQRGQVEEGIDILEQLVVGPESRQDALAALVVSYIQSNQRPRAVELLERLIGENPANVSARVLRAELHLLEGETAAAEQQLRDAVEAAPDNPVGHLVMARFFLQQGNPAEAEAVLRTAGELIPRNEPINLQLAELLERRGAFIEALDVYEQLYAFNPESIIVSNNYASLLAEFREDDPESVAKATRIARRLRGSRIPHFQDTYGWIAFLAGNTAEALPVLTEAAGALPTNPLVRYHFGRVLAATDDMERARAELEAALAIDPMFAKADSARSILASMRQSDG